MLSRTTIERVKETAPLLEARGLDITKLFYEKLFETSPELLNIFNHANQKNDSQAGALAGAILAYAQNIENIEVLLPTVARIANKHASLGVAPEHYPVVGAALLDTLQELLEVDAEHPTIVAWAEAYGVLAGAFIDTEQGLYEQASEGAGGWRGFRAFTVAKVAQEAPGIRSFYLEPSDGQPVAPFLPGQYIGVKVAPAGSEYTAIRQYSLTCEVGTEAYRITVKTEHLGSVSNHMHQLAVGDTVEVSPPAGVFTMAASPKQKLLIAGGVGITPVYSMLLAQLSADDENADRPPLFIQCCRDMEHQIYGEEIASLRETKTFDYKLVPERGAGGDWEGYLNADVLRDWIPDPKNVEAYFCGPMPFMKAINDALLAIGVAAEDLHYEVFGPSETL